LLQLAYTTWLIDTFDCFSIFKVNYVSAHDNETLFDIVSLKVCSTFLTMFCINLMMDSSDLCPLLVDSDRNFCRREMQDKSFGNKCNSTVTGFNHSLKLNSDETL
jgi:hypothetical protein